MANSLQLVAIVTSIVFISATIVTVTAVSAPSVSPSPHADHEQTFSPHLLAMILSTLGFQELSAATANSSLATVTPVTIFAPTDSSLLTCPSCSLQLLLQEHTVPGLYPLHFLLSLPFGTKLETLSPNRCLTITSNTAAATSTASKKIFVNGVEITRPDLFNNGLIMVHGLQGFVSHLSPLSCSVERMTSLTFPPPPPTASFFIMRLMLKDAMLRLRTSGFNVIALALRVKYEELSDLRSMTMFVLDDTTIFTGARGHSYVSDMRFHIVPNRLLMAADLIRLPVETVLLTMEPGQTLVVTNSGGGGALAPMRINYVEIKSFDLVYNSRIAIHKLAMPFQHIHQTTSDGGFCQLLKQSEPVLDRHAGFNETVAPTPAAGSTMEIEDQRGL